MLRDKYQPNTNTALHRKVRDIIKQCGYQYDEEYKVPGTNYSLDFYLPEAHLGVEADGPYHREKDDRKRDEKIFEASGIKVVRFDYRFVAKHDNFRLKQLLDFEVDLYIVTKDERIAKLTG